MPHRTEVEDVGSDDEDRRSGPDPSADTGSGAGDHMADERTFPAWVLIAAILAASLLLTL